MLAQIEGERRGLEEKLDSLGAGMQQQQVKLERKLLILKARLASEEERPAMAEPLGDQEVRSRREQKREDSDSGMKQFVGGQCGGSR